MMTRAGRRKVDMELWKGCLARGLAMVSLNKRAEDGYRLAIILQRKRT